MGVAVAPARQAGALQGDFRPLSWDQRVLVDAPDCAGTPDCVLTLPLRVPGTEQPRPVPGRATPSRAVLFAGCGYLGAKVTLRVGEGKPMLARELWYRLDTGELSGVASRLTDGVVRAWGAAPPPDCELTLCNPATIIQEDPGTPPVHGLFRARGACSLADVGIDPATVGRWRLEPAVAESGAEEVAQ